MKKIISSFIGGFMCLLLMTVKAESELLDSQWWQLATPSTLSISILKGLDFSEKDETGHTVLMYAASNNQNPEIIETLLKKGADIEVRDKDGMTALMHAAAHNQNPEIIETLLKKGADIEARDKEGWTALMVAVGNNQNPRIRR